MTDLEASSSYRRCSRQRLALHEEDLQRKSVQAGVVLPLHI